jgi:hypothetical protein
VLLHLLYLFMICSFGNYAEPVLLSTAPVDPGNLEQFRIEMTQFPLLTIAGLDPATQSASARGRIKSGHPEPNYVCAGLRRIHSPRGPPTLKLRRITRISLSAEALA